MQVLLCDDDAVSRAILSRSLEALGHAPVLAEDGDRAWHAFVRAPIECVMTKGRLRGLSGADLCRRIRKNPDRSWAFVLLVAGREARAEVADGLAAGIDEVATTPVDPDALRGCLGRAERVLALEREVRRRGAEIETLRSLLPVCARCGRIRDERAAWQALRDYLARSGDAGDSPGICSSCWDDAVRPLLADFASGRDSP